jgi:glucose-6-phosphate 1-dehydrogenase
MYLIQGTRKIQHKIIWFLADMNDFTERKLYIFETYGKNPKIITVLEEKNNITNQIFSQKDSGRKAKDIIERESLRKLYTSDDIKIIKGKPFGWCYGENKEIHNKKGEVIAIKQTRCDFYGQKEMVNTVEVTV